jgi:hypothetical protein
MDLISIEQFAVAAEIQGFFFIVPLMTSQKEEGKRDLKMKRPNRTSSPPLAEVKGRAKHSRRRNTTKAKPKTMTHRKETPKGKQRGTSEWCPIAEKPWQAVVPICVKTKKKKRKSKVALRDG